MEELATVIHDIGWNMTASPLCQKVGKPTAMPKWMTAFRLPHLELLLTTYLVRNFNQPTTLESVFREVFSASPDPECDCRVFDAALTLAHPYYNAIDTDDSDDDTDTAAEEKDTIAHEEGPRVCVAPDIQHTGVFHRRGAAMILSLERNYAAVARALAIEMSLVARFLRLRRVCILLPLHNRVLEWSGDSLQQWVKNINPPSFSLNPIPDDVFQGIGSHIGKLKSLLETLKTAPKGLPFQVFLSAPQQFACPKITPSELALCRELTQTHKPPHKPPHKRWYVHAPYVINLCNPEGTKGLECVKQTLVSAAAAGARGVVVHTGQALRNTPELAIATMMQSCLTLLANASPGCPLILETPCGEGTEVCATGDSFAVFLLSLYNSCPSEHRQNIGYCVDTCHVFAAGHNPVAFITRTADMLSPMIPLSLIHFNDSSHGCGTHIDKHFSFDRPGGKIGLRLMRQVAQYARDHGVDCICE
jgi:deoxyribonuclease-4